MTTLVQPLRKNHEQNQIALLDRYVLNLVVHLLFHYCSGSQLLLFIGCFFFASTIPFLFCYWLSYILLCFFFFTSCCSFLVCVILHFVFILCIALYFSFFHPVFFMIFFCSIPLLLLLVVILQIVLLLFS